MIDIDQDIAHGVCQLLIHYGLLKPTSPRLPDLFADISRVVTAHLALRDEATIGFIEWWGIRGHEYHDPVVIGQGPSDWRLCQNQICSSLMRTVQELKPRETAPASAQLAPADAPAPLS